MIFDFEVDFEVDDPNNFLALNLYIIDINLSGGQGVKQYVRPVTCNHIANNKFKAHK